MFKCPAQADDGHMISTDDTPRVLRRRYSGHIVAGVATGLSDYLDIDVSVVRLGLVVLSLMGGMGVPLYGAAWLFIPDESSDESIAAHFLHHQAPERA
jgi:phage shock protein PspC (stress-responsive transcriptional regulator)